MEIEALQNLVILGFSVGTLVTGLTQAIKKLLPDTFHAILPYVVGVVVALIGSGFHWMNILYGLFFGLIATGEYKYIKEE